MSYYRFNWICPFWKSDGKTVIRCEGGRLVFPSARECRIYAKTYCASYGYGRCTLAAELIKYHERRDHEGKDQKEKRQLKAEAQGKAHS